VLLCEDNLAVVFILTTLVSRSPQLLHELRKLWRPRNSMDIKLRPLCIRIADHIIADYASRLAARGDCKLDPTLLKDLQRRWGR